MATQVLAQRGHDVTLYEKSDSLGGQLSKICALPFKDDLRQYKDWDIKATMNCGAKIVLGKTVTKEFVEQEDPDALFIAAGASLFTPNIPGINGSNVYDVISVDNGNVETGKKVVVCGGGLSGLECALALAMKGKDVTVVDMIPAADFGKDMFIFNHNMLMMLLKKYKVQFVGLSKVERFTSEGVEVIDKNWERSTLKADSIVTAFGMKSNNKIASELSNIIAETYIVGDCDTVKGIFHANNTAFNYAVEV